ncbi:hypothetical protein BJ165DRAFT_1532573 [Panaeolus papilionaceus]|nr:hypothetical protein BJ165DRAFT_1532573 [Panaeolus papilionaceus]
MDLSDSEINRKRVADQRTLRRKMDLQAAKEAADEMTIAAGRGQRKAMEKAKKNAIWREEKRGTKRKPSRSPSPVVKRKRTAASIKQTDSEISTATQRLPRPNTVKKGTSSSTKTHRTKIVVPSSDISADESPVDLSSDEQSFSDEEQSEDGDHGDELSCDDDNEAFSESGLKRQMLEEIPSIGGGVENIFDEDDDVEFVPRRKLSSSPMEYPDSVSSSPSPDIKAHSARASNKSTSKGGSQTTSKKNEQVSDHNDDLGDSDSSLPKSILPEHLITGKRKNVDKNKATNKKVKKRDLAMLSERSSSVKSQAIGRSSISKTQHRHKLMVAKVAAAPSDDEPSDENPSSSLAPPSEDETEWPRVARLDLRGNGKLLNQNRYIIALVHLAIDIVLKTIHLENPWPEREKWAAYRLEILLKAARKLLKKEREYSKIILRVQLDPTFCNKVGKWFMDRISHCRNGVIAAARREICAYRLGKGDECIERVRLLMLDDAYCHPGGFATMGPEKRIEYISESTPSKNLKFMNPVIIDTVIEAFFSKSTSSGWKYRDLYETSLPDRPEHQRPEIPMSLLALAAAAVRTAIWEMRDGVIPLTAKQVKQSGSTDARVQDQFTGDAVFGVYQGHISHLKALQVKGKVSYHKLMAEIYERVKARDTGGGSGLPDGKFTSAPLAGVDTSFLEN